VTSPNIVDQLDQAIEQIMVNPDCALKDFDPSVNELLSLAAELRTLPRTDFKSRLKADLQQSALAAAATPRQAESTPVLPTLFGAGYGDFPVQRMNFVASFLLHAAAMALIVTSGIWMVQRHEELRPQVTAILLSEPSPYALPPAPDEAGGGGGGGDRDKMAASKGTTPRFSMQQMTPPAIVIRNNNPRLPVEPTVIGPPNVKLPQSSQMGDPLSAVLAAPSNGPGFAGGIGSGTGGGVGSGYGPGVGPGRSGGYGGGVFRVGGGVSAPRTLYDPEPEYSEEARKAKYQGSVVLWVVVDANGRPRDVKVARSLGMGLDEKAIEAVRNWKFEPAKKDGQPVAVQVNIEVNFRLY
jgi:periplasmic protein TonB